MRSLIFLILFFDTASLLGQEVMGENDITNQLWTDYNISYRLSDQWDLFGDMGFRTITPHKWDRIYVRPAVRHQLPKIFFNDVKYKEEIAAGIGLFYTFNQEASNRLEIRPFQGYKLDWPDRKRFRLRHYVRLEERFDMNTRNWKNTFGLRFRYLAELTLKLQGDFLKFNKGVYLPFSMELFWNLVGARQFNDHLRLNAGIGYAFSEKWKGEFHLGYHYSRNTVKGDFNTNDIVYRLRAFCRIK